MECFTHFESVLWGFILLNLHQAGFISSSLGREGDGGPGKLREILKFIGIIPGNQALWILVQQTESAAGITWWEESGFSPAGCASHYPICSWREEPELAVWGTAFVSAAHHPSSFLLVTSWFVFESYPQVSHCKLKAYATLCGAIPQSHCCWHNFKRQLLRSIASCFWVIKYKGGNKWEKSILSFRLHPVLTVQGTHIPQASHVLSPWLLQLVQGCDPNWINETQFRDYFFGKRNSVPTGLEGPGAAVGAKRTCMRNAIQGNMV